MTIDEALRHEVVFMVELMGSHPIVAAELRRIGFWTQKEIAERVGCSKQYIHLVESMALRKAKRLAKEVIKEHGSLGDTT
jgi:transcriptional regulator